MKDNPHLVTFTHSRRVGTVVIPFKWTQKAIRGQLAVFTAGESAFQKSGLRQP